MVVAHTVGLGQREAKIEVVHVNSSCILKPFGGYTFGGPNKYCFDLVRQQRHRCIDPLLIDESLHVRLQRGLQPGPSKTPCAASGVMLTTWYLFVMGILL